MKSFERIAKEYIHHLKAQGRSTKNVKFSLRVLREYLEGNGIDFRYVRTAQAQGFQTHLSTAADDEGKVRYGRGSVLGIMGCAGSFYGFLKHQRIVHSNPFIDVRRVKTGKPLPKNILNEDEMNTFLSHLKRFGRGCGLIHRRNLYKAHVIAELMYSTGARVNEVMRLKPEDLDFTRGFARITDAKTNQVREGILNSFAERVLRIYVEKMRGYVLFGKNSADTELLFGSKTHLVTWLNDILGRESEGLGFGRFTSHQFRHALGYHLLRGGCDIRYIQEILGHKAMRSTQIYTRVDRDDLRSVLDEFHPRRLREVPSPPSPLPGIDKKMMGEGCEYEIL
jgi:integrase/recombinase XerD